MVVLALFLVGLIIAGCLIGAGVLVLQTIKDVKSLGRKRDRYASSRKELESGEEDR